MPFSTPPTASNGNPIASAHVNTLRDNDNWFNGLLSGPTQAGQVPISSSTTAAAYGFLGSASIVDGAVGTNQIADGAIGPTQTAPGAITSTVVDSAVAALLVPATLGGWFREASEIPSGWARETTADGRMFVGDGETFSVTFDEETNYGSSWGHTHPVRTAGSAVVGVGSPDTTLVNFSGDGTGHGAHSSHAHTIDAATDAREWAIPSRVYVAARRA